MNDDMLALKKARKKNKKKKILFPNKKLNDWEL